MNRKNIFKTRQGCFVHLYNKTLVFKDFYDYRKWQLHKDKSLLLEEIYKQ